MRYRLFIETFNWLVIIRRYNKQREHNIMDTILNFNDRKNTEKNIRDIWKEFRECLANGEFSYNQIEKAKQTKFLKSYDDLFCQHSGIKENTITIGELKSNVIGRGSILSKEEIPNYERFLPKEEFINEDNRFSPSGVEWLYLVIGNEKKIRKCAELECRAKNGDRFGFCHFKFDIEYEDCNLVDLTIADDISYMELNRCLKEYEQKFYKRCAKINRELGCVPINHRNSEEIKEVFTRWCVYTHSKLLSEQIFVPLEKCDKKSHIYAPFQTMAQYYRSLGYSGIVYGSTVCSSGKNIVLFDKNMAYPIDTIEEYDIL
ncbi:RES domain-containing protein [Peptostreptococcus stomatis]|uniref:RES domain-containing protein n=1 Tax=Peptostreptococcus stomatis TaxID=341694 RepID=UPI0028E91F2D|nr:RES domain-containing protein [Peptostreptococcus stomatis]